MQSAKLGLDNVQKGFSSRRKRQWRIFVRPMPVAHHWSPGNLERFSNPNLHKNHLRYVDRGNCHQQFATLKAMGYYMLLNA
jgi:hypothetical protein